MNDFPIVYWYLSEQYANSFTSISIFISHACARNPYMLKYKYM